MSSRVGVRSLLAVLNLVIIVGLLIIFPGRSGYVRFSTESAERACCCVRAGIRSSGKAFHAGHV